MAKRRSFLQATVRVQCGGPGDVKVLCSGKFGDDIAAARLERFLSWVLHLDHSFTIKTECAYKTSATVVISSVSLGIWFDSTGAVSE